MRILKTLVLLLFTISLAGQDSIPESYEARLQYAWDKYTVLLMDDSNDVVLHPIETVPKMTMASDNPSVPYYKLTYTPVKKKGVIFILDTEGEFTHVDLQEAINPKLNKVLTGESTISNINGHGIHCAGIIAGKRTGLLYPWVASGELEVGAVKVLRNNGSGSLDVIEKGLDYVIEVAPDLIKLGKVVGVNMSLGGNGYFPDIAAKISVLKRMGVIVVVASGNDGRNSLSAPANSPDALAFGSINRQLVRSSFSNYGPGLFAVSFGQDVYSTYIKNLYATLDGTSMAAPNGLAYIMYVYMITGNYSAAIDPSNYTDLGVPKYDLLYGNGLPFYKGTTAPPPPPVKDTSITVFVPINGVYPVVVGTQIFNGETYYVTGVGVEATNNTARQAIRGTTDAVKSFLINRGFVVPSDYDEDEIAKTVWLFLNINFKNLGLSEKSKITYLELEDPTGARIRVYEPLVVQVSSLSKGIICYERN